MGLPQNIRKRRTEMGMSQEDLALAIGYKSRSAIAKIESGENGVSHTKLSLIARVLDTSVEYLFTGMGAPRGFVSGTLNDENVEKLSGSTSNTIDYTQDAESPSKVVAVVLAGGKSTRNMQNIPNQFIEILGKPMIMYVLEAYQKHPLIDEIRVVCLKGWGDIVRAYAEQYGIGKLADIVLGGTSGVLSVKNALDSLSSELQEDDIIILQESTRPMISGDTISRLLLACRNEGSAVICEPMYGHMQFIRTEEGVDYIDRNRVVEMQSPEAYRFGLLKDAFAKTVSEGDRSLLDETYCAFMMHSLGYRLNFVEGPRNNIKALHPEDVAVLSALLKQRVD